MTGRNEAQHGRICNDIRDMHEMADMLLHPPAFGDRLYLYSDVRSSPSEEEEYKMVLKKY